MGVMGEKTVWWCACYVTEGVMGMVINGDADRSGGSGGELVDVVIVVLIVIMAGGGVDGDENGGVLFQVVVERKQDRYGAAVEGASGCDSMVLGVVCRRKCVCMCMCVCVCVCVCVCACVSTMLACVRETILTRYCILHKY